MSDDRTREEQIEDLMDHYEDPRHYGKIEPVTVSFRGTNPGCGDIITMYLKISADGKIEDVSFEGEGCTISQAAASMSTEIALGKTLQEIDSLPADYMMDIVGNEVALTRPKCSTLGLNVIRDAIREYRKQILLKNNGITETPKPDTEEDKGTYCPSH